MGYENLSVAAFDELKTTAIAAKSGDLAVSYDDYDDYYYYYDDDDYYDYYYDDDDDYDYYYDDYDDYDYTDTGYGYTDTDYGYTDYGYDDTDYDYDYGYGYTGYGYGYSNYGYGYTGYYNDGATVYVMTSADSTVDLSTGYYGTAVNIDASSSTGSNSLGGNWASNIIWSGAGSTFMWGGNDFANDILVGGTGVDTFACGKYTGNDTVLNASAADKVFLYDVNLSDIVATASDGYTVALAFNTGFILTVTGTSSASADFVLPDGSTYWYGCTSRQWYQTS